MAPGSIRPMLWSREPDNSWDDRTLILRSLMRVEAKVDRIELLLLEDDDEEDREGS